MSDVYDVYKAGRRFGEREVYLGLAADRDTGTWPLSREALVLAWNRGWSRGVREARTWLGKEAG